MIRSLNPSALLSHLWLVGCGAMGGALAARWMEAGLPPESLSVIDPSPTALPAALSHRLFADAASVDTAPTLVVLAVKPQMVVTVAAGLRAALGDGAPMVLSMLAGVRVPVLGQLFPGSAIVRIMPNTPARIGRGVTALYGPALAAEDRATVDGLLKAAGTTLWLEDEQKFDAVTALSGSGPAFLFRFVEAMTGAGEAAGLEPETSALLAMETVVGAALLMAQSNESPAALRASVTSPNGTTQAGLDVLDGDGALSSLLRQTVRAAAERSRVLAAAAETAMEAGQMKEAVRAG